MRKLSLKVEELTVESFEISAAEGRSGTVRAHYNTDDCNTPQYMCVSDGNTCDATCGGTCDATCDTCEDSCDGTCEPTLGAVTCPPECYD